MTPTHKTPHSQTSGPKQPLGELATQSLRLIEAFDDLLKAETEALNNADFKAMEKLQQDKLQLVERYSVTVNTLKANREELRHKYPDMRDKIMAAREKFFETAQQNMKAIERQRLSSQRLAERLIEAARRGVRKKSGYGSGGQRVEQPPLNGSFSLNQTL